MQLPLPPDLGEQQIALVEALRSKGFRCFVQPSGILIHGHKDRLISALIGVPFDVEDSRNQELLKVGGVFEDPGLSGKVAEVLRAIDDTAVDLQGTWMAAEAPHFRGPTFGYSVSLQKGASIDAIVDTVVHVAGEVERATALIWETYHAAEEASPLAAA